jgi:hypothetical protein
MPADHELDPLDRWLNQQVRPLPPPAGTFELITRRARRRRVRKAVVSVASAAAVAAAVGVAVPVGMSLNLTAPPQNASLAGGQVQPTTSGTQSPLGAANQVPAAAAASSAASAVPSIAGPKGGYLPPNFQPYSVTWDSLNTGWVIGPAGTPGQCDNANPDICTSVARTDDGGQTWHGLPAPDTGSPSGPDGVSGIRYLDGKNGWAFGPELWATHNGGESWTQVSTGGQRVTDLETAGTRAYALFAQCEGTSAGGFAADCTSYTLMSAAADSDKWTPVGDATNGLTAQGAATSGMIALWGTTGYLAAPDGTLYSGSGDGAWQRAGTLPCQPGSAQASGLPATAALALSSASTLATLCHGDTAGAPPKVYTSSDSGATWVPVTADWAGVTGSDTPTSLGATASGTLLLATSQGIYLLPKGAAHWQASSASGSAAPQGGFTYVGMTSSEQGVALPADTGLHEIWMTTDGGQTWQARPIKS